MTDHGTLGVHIFFVISGFLITELLIRERTRTGGISLSLFYARRTLRIFPPFYLFLILIGIGAWKGVFNVHQSDFIYAATYTVNYAPPGSWITGHLWSLSVEEQFYLVWPLVIKLAGLPRAFWIAGTLAVTAPLICLSLYLIDAHVGSRLARYFPFVADSIAAGCVLAGIAPWLRRQERLFRWFGIPAGDLVIPLIVLLDFGRNHPRIHFAFTETALNLCICYALLRYTAFPACAVGKMLNNRALAFVGRLSYSWYLWQQIFMNPSGTNPLERFPVNVAASFCVALVSYYTVELPLADLRRRMRPASA